MASLNQQTEQTLDYTYERETLIFEMTLKRIDDAMRDRFPAPDDEEHPATWAHVGDLQHINRLLQQIREQLEGRNQEAAHRGGSTSSPR